VPDEHAPRPGDPRAPGPRPEPGRRDLAWASLAVVVGVVTIAQLVGLTMALLGLETAPSTGASFVGFVITVVWLLTIYWVVVGAWRRTVWGCPFEHTASARAGRRCARHPLVDPDGGQPREPDG
jgi:hypothetical protein